MWLCNFLYVPKVTSLWCKQHLLGLPSSSGKSSLPADQQQGTPHLRWGSWQPYEWIAGLVLSLSWILKCVEHFLNQITMSAQHSFPTARLQGLGTPKTSCMRCYFCCSGITCKIGYILERMNQLCRDLTDYLFFVVAHFTSRMWNFLSSSDTGTDY